MKTIGFNYCFILPTGHQVQIPIQLDSHDLSIVNNLPDVLPEWTALDFYQCPHCPLSILDHARCPLAKNLITIVNHLDILSSYDQVHIKIETQNRTISQKTTIQKGVGSLVGLVTATSGCPHTIFFKPMARFHLPLADDQETICRVASMYLLGQYFLKTDGEPSDFQLKGLIQIYDNMHKVNASIAKRLRSASKTDSIVNAIVLLDLFTNLLPFSIETQLKDIKYLFRLD